MFIAFAFAFDTWGRYMVATILQFQMQKGLCDLTSEYEPNKSGKLLSDCSLYGSKEAGDALKFVWLFLFQHRYVLVKYVLRFRVEKCYQWELLCHGPINSKCLPDRAQSMRRLCWNTSSRCTCSWWNLIASMDLTLDGICTAVNLLSG